ncbi:MAG: hypothetical protein ACOYLC_15430, partial [Armatimonadaceae bacterium]
MSNIPSQRSYSLPESQVESSAEVERKDGQHCGGAKVDESSAGKTDVNMENSTDKGVEDDQGTPDPSPGSTDANSSGIRIDILLDYGSQKSWYSVQCALRKVITMFMRTNATQGIVVAEDNSVRVHGCFPKNIREKFSKLVKAIENVRSNITFTCTAEEVVYGEVERGLEQITAPSRCWFCRPCQCHHNRKEQLNNSGDQMNNSEAQVINSGDRWNNSDDQLSNSGVQVKTPAPNQFSRGNTSHITVKNLKIIDRSFVNRVGDDLAYLLEVYAQSTSASQFQDVCTESFKLLFSVHDYLLRSVPPDGCPESRTLDFDAGATPLATPCPTPKPQSMSSKSTSSTFSTSRSDQSAQLAKNWAESRSAAAIVSC